MTQKELDTLIYCISRLSDGWDARIIVKAYKHLPMDQAISAITKDLARYCKKQESMTLAAQKKTKCETTIQ